MLTLPIKEKWFDMIRQGVKTDEYREKTPYYEARLQRHLGSVIKVKFQNGYQPNSPFIICDVLVGVGYGRVEWGAEWGKVYFKLSIAGIESEGNINE